MENENAKIVFLNICEKGQEQWNAKILLEGYKKRSKKAMVKYMLYPNIVDLINLNVSRMNAAITYAFKHWWSPKGHIGQKGHGNKIDDPNQTGSSLM